jgi:hypothetical protein
MCLVVVMLGDGLWNMNIIHDRSKLFPIPTNESKIVTLPPPESFEKDFQRRRYRVEEGKEYRGAPQILLKNF